MDEEMYIEPGYSGFQDLQGGDCSRDMQVNVDEGINVLSLGNLDTIENLTLLTEGPETDSSPRMNVYNMNSVEYRSPNETMETIETYVSTNMVSLVSGVEPPKVGMVFKGREDIEHYYKSYAEQEGFGVSRVQGAYRKDKEGNSKGRRGMTWRCECWGAPDMRAQRAAKLRSKAMDVGGSGGNVNGAVGVDELARGKRKSKKCYCEAKIYGSVNGEGLWVLKTVVLEHTHLISPSMSKLVKEYRMKKLTSTARRKLINFYEEGVPVSQIRGCLATENPDLPNVKDLQHEVYKERRLKMAGGDARAMMAYFDYMQSDNQKFYHAHRLDTVGRLKDVFWVDARSRVAYEEFGDVVCFDATYLTNHYELPFTNFVGVNHHGQTILLGCALVSHEDCETFRWIFRQWISCMGKAPVAILTDQAAAMRGPLAEVMPNTRHRWCIWHIMKKFPEKLGKCKMYTEFKNPLKAVIYESFTVEEFQNRWCQLMKKYNLEDNEWLQELFVERHMWVPAYMKEYFWAGMKTTQRVESINRFFDGFVNRKTKLFEFPDKYCKAMKKRTSDETEADARDSKYMRRLVSTYKVEKIFQKFYTDAKFQEVQTECVRTMYVIPKEEHIISAEEIRYVLEDRVWIVPEGESEAKCSDYRRYYSLNFNPVTKDICCDCRKFEKDDILCKHIIRVWDQNLVKEVPSKYILGRRRKDLIRRHTRVKAAYHDPSQTEHVKRFNKLFPDVESLCEEAAAVDDETIEVVRTSVEQLRVDVKQRRENYVAKNGPTVPPFENFPGSEIGSSNPPCTGSTPASVKKPNPEAGDGNGFAADIGCMYVDPGKMMKDPYQKKRPRGRPKGSRNKPLSETGYKGANGKGIKVSGGDPGATSTGKLQVKRKKMNNPYTEFFEIVEHAESEWDSDFAEDLAQWDK